MILLTGATGKTGGAAAKELAGKGPLRAIVRNADKAKALKDMGVELVVGDVGDPESLKKAMTGVEQALLVLPNGEHQERLEMQFVDVAKASGVKKIVKVSSIEAAPDSKLAMQRLHCKVEDHIKASGLAWTMVKPSFFMANFFANAATIKANGTIVMPGGKGKIGMIDNRDIGAVIAHVMTTSGHDSKNYLISGPEALTFSDAAQAFSEVLGKTVVYIDQPVADFEAMLAKFLPAWHAHEVAALFGGIAEGTLDIVTPTVKELLGRDPISLKQFIKDNIVVFK
ncbi:MAG: SDR family oxidoreductase [Rhodobacteraceae bacterium]|nr:SDR family oxidoreductase [Paracoccaceae bacterium]